MSATLEEHNLIGNWLNADIFVSNFRPLNLREYATIDGEIFDLVEKRPVRRLSEEFLIKSDIKCFIGLVAFFNNKTLYHALITCNFLNSNIYM